MQNEYLSHVKPKFIDFVRMNLRPLKTTAKILEAAEGMSYGSAEEFKRNWITQPNMLQTSLTLLAMSLVTLFGLALHIALPETFGSGNRLIDWVPFVPSAIASLGLVKPAISGVINLVHY